MKLIIHTDRKPWLNDEPLEKGTVIDIEDEITARAFLDNDFALEIPGAPVAPVAPAAEPKAKNA